jgi:signal transduction histidine kinase
MLSAMPAMAVHVALNLALVESLGLGLLLLRARAVPGIGLLVAFLFGVAVWVASCELPVWFGAGASALGAALVAFSPLTSAAFLHFVLLLCRVHRRRGWVRAAYVLGGAAAALGLVSPPGEYRPWHGFDWFFMPNAVGWLVGAAWALLALAGHLVMLHHWWMRRGPPRGQLVAMCLASGWGLLCMSGYGFAPLGIDHYPLPLLLLPLYPLILVYGILRYQLMIVNAWARRALAWALVVGAGSATVIGLAALPLPFYPTMSGWRLWTTAVIVLLVSGLLLDPFRRLATRLVYPGSHLADGAAENWRAALSAAGDYAELAAIAARELGAQLQVRVGAIIDPAGTTPAVNGEPTLVCLRGADRWITELIGWDAAPPGPRYAARLFGVVLAEAAARLEQAIAFAQRERERQQQERLAELGALAATVAHDIRNPLNIIAMAAAAAPAEVRSEIATQTARISQLATDLLDYAKSWQVAKQPLDLADQVHSIARYPQIETGPGIEPGMVVAADPRRLPQVLLNLIENARAAIAELPAGGRILVDAARAADGGLELAVCDNGHGVPPEIRPTLFQPFVSRRPNGTGLGLAIVARIMHAHGGSVRLEQRPGWTTCFVLSFPQ